MGMGKVIKELRIKNSLAQQELGDVSDMQKAVFFTNNGILGNNNNNNLILNGCTPASQIDKALMSLCYSLTTTQKKQVMEYVIKILSEEEK